MQATNWHQICKDTQVIYTATKGDIWQSTSVVWKWKKKRQTTEHTNTVCLSQAGHTHKPSCDELHSCLHEVHTVLEDDLKRKNIHVQYLGGVLNSLQYSRFSLSRSPNDSLKYFEIYVHLHIRFAELRKNSIEWSHFTKNIYSDS